MAAVRQPAEIDWDRIDKTKFFYIGVGAFSSVTTLLYPLSVIKTNQQVAHGEQTTAQTTSKIWRSRGLRGFYRGYATVIFATIPSRVVYLTSLEVTKSTVSKAGKQLDLPETALAGSANFVAGGMSSLLVQLVNVPLDVVTQRQMILGGGLHGGRSPAKAGAAQAAAQGTAAAAQAPGTNARSPVGGSGSASSGSGPPPGGQAGLHTAARRLGSRNAALHTLVHRSAPAPSTPGGLEQRLRPGALPEARPACNAGFQQAGGGAQQHGSLQQQGLARQAACQTRSVATSRSLAAAAGAATEAAGPGALGIVRAIIQEEGVRGLYRGFGASVATIVPSSAMWWGSYGMYQKVIWNIVGQSSGLPEQKKEQAAASPDAASQSEGSASEASTLSVMMVQTTASVMAGLTSAGLTNPLDLIKTRIQVARKQDGQATTFRVVAAEVLREDGWTGLFRGAAPRMASSALWGTAMVSVYEALKRVSVKD